VACRVTGKVSMAKGGSTMEARPRLGCGLQRKEEGMRLWSRQHARLDREVTDSMTEDEDGPQSSPERMWTFSHLPAERRECSGEAGVPGEEMVLEREREEA